MKYKGNNHQLLICLLIILSLFTIITPVYAADSAVYYEGQAKKFVFLSDNAANESDLFGDFKHVMPGDTVTQDITIKNNSEKNVNIYLRAVSHDAVNRPVSGSSIVSMQDFLNQLSMTVHQDSKELFSASPDELDGLSEKVLLGKFNSGQSTKLTISLHVPITLGNEYANRTGEVDWVFTVEEVSSGGTKPPSAGGNGSNESKVPESLNGESHFAYVVGYPDGTVRPMRDITRAEVATIFHRLLTPEAQIQYDSNTNQFDDVKKGAWYNHAISTMANMGIVGGYPDGSFRPNAPITRAEFAAIAVRFDRLAEVNDSPFIDIDGHWAQKDIITAASKGWVNGYEDATFRPDQNITRAEVMAIVNRVLLRLPQTTEDLLDGMIAWSDNADTTAWYYIAVQEATNGHEFERKDETYERWTVLNNAKEKENFLDRIRNLFK